MNAQAVTAALKGKWHGSYGYARCVAHNDGRPSMRLRDGETGKLLVFCHAGCPPESILNALKAGRMLDASEPESNEDIRAREDERRKKDERTLRTVKEIWSEAKPIQRMGAERYLQNRAITIDLPPSLRHHAELRHPNSHKKCHAMVAGVQAPDRTITGVHRTFITPSGVKFPKGEDKFSLGHIAGGAVRLAAAAEEMAIGEGIETCLSFMEFKRIPTWAALSTSGMRSIILPETVRIVHLIVDNDENRAGETAAFAAGERFQKEGREVRFDYPPDQFKDFNDYAVHHAR